jgi:osmotically-inducible protein OsmY
VTDDLTIQRRLLDDLARVLGPEAAGVGVVVDGGVVRLTGFLRAMGSRRAAQHAAHAVPGVRAVVDDLAVRDQAFPARDNGALARAAAEALATDPHVPREGIQLTVYKGYVTLQGSVVDAHHAETAERVVRRVPGVLGVCRDCTVTDFDALDREESAAADQPTDRPDGAGASPAQRAG